MSPAGWIELTVQCPSDDLAGLVAEGLVACGAAGVEELPGALRAWLPADDVDAASALAAAVRETLQAHTGLILDVDGRLQPDTDWAQTWRQGLQPRRIGERIVVAPTWTAPELRPGDVLLSIDPEMAFGTGEHGTTRGMLRLMQRLEIAGTRVLDLGTGSAILAIAAALLGAAEVDAVESDADALVNARDNVERHRAGDRVRLDEVMVDPAWLASRTATYDVILANILSGVIRPLLPSFATALRTDGALLVSGILSGEAADVTRDAEAVGFVVIAEEPEDEWWSGLLVQSGALTSGSPARHPRWSA